MRGVASRDSVGVRALDWVAEGIASEGIGKAIFFVSSE